MRKILIIIFGVFLLEACSNKKDDPLIIPPKFNEMPDPKNPEKPSQGQQDVDVEKLKDLLLQD